MDVFESVYHVLQNVQVTLESVEEAVECVSATLCRAWTARLRARCRVRGRCHWRGKRYWDLGYWDPNQHPSRDHFVVVSRLIASTGLNDKTNPFAHQMRSNPSGLHYFRFGSHQMFRGNNYQGLGTGPDKSRDYDADHLSDKSSEDSRTEKIIKERASFVDFSHFVLERNHVCAAQCTLSDFQIEFAGSRVHGAVHTKFVARINID